jgi:hypothetical protein
MESMGDGVLFTYVKLDKVEDCPDGYRALHFLSKTHYRSVSLFRHPELKATVGTARWEHVRETLSNQGMLLFGREYSNLSSLAAASSVLRRIALYRFVMSAAETAERLNVLKQKLVPGVFCSELVATLFLTLEENVDSGITLLKRQFQPFEVGPSVLGDRQLSHLVEIPNAIVEIGQSVDVTSPKRWKYGPFFQRDQRVQRERDSFAVASSVSVEQMKATLQRLDKSFEWVYDTLKTQPRDSAEGLANSMWDLEQVTADQRLINSLFSDFDSRAASSKWAAFQRRSELRKCIDTLIAFRMERLKKNLNEQP